MTRVESIAELSVSNEKKQSQQRLSATAELLLKEIEFVQRSAPFKRRVFATTDSELRLMATLAQIGEIRMPKNGKSSPAATGTLTML